MKEDENKEPSVTEKGTSSVNIFECIRNLLDQLDVTYQRAFMVSPVKEGLYQPSPAQEIYYDKMAKSLIKVKVRSDGTINNDELNKAITKLKSDAPRLSGFEDQSKVAKIQKGKVCHRKCQREGPFEYYQRV